MGRRQSTSSITGSARLRRLRRRKCLRKGCSGTYLPRRWNQRYCQDPECQREIQRWQAAKRQRRRRGSESVRFQHAAAQRQRRQQHKVRVNSQSEKSPSTPVEPRVSGDARGHAAKDFSCALCCDRPGCSAPPRRSIRNTARYCSDPCRLAIARVRDRERKWLARATSTSQIKRHREYQNARRLRANAVTPADGTDRISPQRPAHDLDPRSEAPRSHIIDHDPPPRLVLAFETSRAQ